MSNLKRRLSRKLILSIMLMAVPVFILSLGIFYSQSRYLIRQGAIECSKSILRTTIQRVNNYMTTIEASTNANAWLLEENFCPDSLKLITQRIQRTLIGIMTGADRVNVVPLHGQQVTPEFVRGHCSAGFRTVIMPVHTLEDDAHSVELHDSVHDLKAPEPDPDPGHLKYLTCLI